MYIYIYVSYILYIYIIYIYICIQTTSKISDPFHPAAPRRSKPELSLSQAPGGELVILRDFLSKRVTPRNRCLF